MKSLLCFLIFIGCIFANTSIESVYSKINELSTNEDVLLSHRDSGSVLSSLWKLSGNFSVEDFKSANSQWTNDQGNSIFSAFIIDDVLFLKIKENKDNTHLCMCLSPRNFGLQNINVDLSAVTHVSLKQPKQGNEAQLSIIKIIPKTIKTSKKQTVVNPENLASKSQNPVVGISSLENGLATIILDRKTVLKQQMEKGKVYPLPMSLSAKKVTIRFTYSEKPSSETVAAGILHLHTSNAKLYKKTFTLENQSFGVFTAPLPFDFMTANKLEAKVVKGKDEVKQVTIGTNFGKKVIVIQTKNTNPKLKTDVEVTLSYVHDPSIKIDKMTKRFRINSTGNFGVNFGKEILSVEEFKRVKNHKVSKVKFSESINFSSVEVFVTNYSAKSLNAFVEYQVTVIVSDN
ncbi:hypothetical protein [Candidatus Uabimicrobium sp. HlEnr_7]|uniref:hypothetical protein n=1 Tax=Candidatus Uabimicrobium helgolandensis TaxID=3095367 RepID=UPI00355649A8